MQKRSLSHSLLLSLALLLANSGLLAKPATLDPLAPDEISRAISAATTSPTATVSTTRQLLATPVPELLLVERHPAPKGQAQRLADVFTYDYSSNETIHTLIDLGSNQAIRTERQQNLQLPLTDNEIQRAFELVFNDDEERALLDAEFHRITGETLTDPQQQLEIKAFVFHASSLPEQLNPASAQCGLHRCAQVLLYTADSIVFEVSPIVNLSAGVITQNIGF